MSEQNTAARFAVVPGVRVRHALQGGGNHSVALRSFQLASDEVHSWCVGLDVPPETSARFYATLSFDERSRSARFRFERDRQRFVVAHGVLRDLLGRYLQTEPGRIRYVYNEFGKPDLSPEFGGRLKFNLSHSAGLALIAIAADANVGVDLEPIRPFAGMNEVAAEFFPPQARAAYEIAPPTERAAVFFRWWTRIEAAGKAIGCGLVQAVSCLDRVSHQSCDAFRGFAIAVAAQTGEPRIVSWRRQEHPSGSSRIRPEPAPRFDEALRTRS